MAPEVGSIDIGHPVKFVTIDLNSPKGFDAKGFDRKVMSFRPDLLDLGIYSLKYVVVGDVVYCFDPGPSGSISHAVGMDILKSHLKAPLTLCSAGSISRLRRDGKITRFIYDSSYSLSDELRRNASDVYQQTVMKEKLGQFFEFRRPY